MGNLLSLRNRVYEYWIVLFLFFRIRLSLSKSCESPTAIEESPEPEIVECFDAVKIEDHPPPSHGLSITDGRAPTLLDCSDVNSMISSVTAETLVNRSIDWRLLDSDLFEERCRFFKKMGMREGIQRMNLTLMLGTIRACHEGGYWTTETKAHVTLDQQEMQRSIMETKIVTGPPRFPPDERRRKEVAELLVMEMDSIDAAQFLHLQGKTKNPCVLNLASALNPGGGCMWGTLAQEESLMYRSSYYRCLNATIEKEQPDGVRWEDHPMAGRYPWPRDDFAVYSPNVIVFRKNQSQSWGWEEKPFLMSFVAVAALKNPRLDHENRLKEADEEVTLEKIHLAFQVAYENGHDCIILGALGCGAYHNPPEHIAELFSKAIPVWSRSFTTITFAILAPRSLPGNNFDVFHTQMEITKQSLEFDC